MILTNKELSYLEEALGAHMEDGFGCENFEGCWDDDQWAELTELSRKLMIEINDRRNNSA
jgi:hypothetical protein